MDNIGKVEICYRDLRHIYFSKIVILLFYPPQIREMSARTTLNVMKIKFKVNSLFLLFLKTIGWTISIG